MSKLEEDILKRNVAALELALKRQSPWPQHWPQRLSG